MDLVSKITDMFLPTSKKSTKFFRHCGFLENARSKLQSDCQPSLSSDPEEEWFQMGPWTTTSLWTNKTGDNSCRKLTLPSPWASPGRTRYKKCSLHHSQGQGSYLEPVVESTVRIESSSRVLESGVQRIWSPLYSNCKRDTGSLQRGSSCYGSDWYWSTIPLASQFLLLGWMCKGWVSCTPHSWCYVESVGLVGHTGCSNRKLQSSWLLSRLLGLVRGQTLGCCLRIWCAEETLV